MSVVVILLVAGTTGRPIVRPRSIHPATCRTDRRRTHRLTLRPRRRLLLVELITGTRLRIAGFVGVTRVRPATQLVRTHEGLEGLCRMRELGQLVWVYARREPEVRPANVLVVNVEEAVVADADRLVAAEREQLIAIFGGQYRLRQGRRS